MQCIFICSYRLCSNQKELNHMTFQLKAKKQTDNKTIRFPVELIERIEEAIQNQDVTFSRFVIQACEYALDNMKENQNKQ